MNSTNPVISIGLPVYNCERFVMFAIKSVLNQSFADFELIITDDGSTDNTLDILGSVNDVRVILIADGQNQGISYRLNQQINISRGKYFCRMDADDLMFPDRLERQLRYLEEHPDVDVIGSSAVIIDNDNAIIGTRLYCNNGEDFESSVFIHPTVFGKIDYFKKFYYSDKLKGVEDADLWIRSKNLSKFMTLNEPILFYRDPLVFKLNTYLFRQKQYKEALICWRRKKMIGNLQFARLYVFTFVKSFLSIILKLTRSDKMMIAKRNQNCEADFRSEKEKLLKNILSNEF